MKLDVNNLPTPCYVIDEELLIKNLKILKDVQDRTGCKILLAQKAFSNYCTYPLISKYLYGTTASSLNEARLAYEEFHKEVHIYNPAYREDEFDDILKYCDHIVFNSFNQWNKYKQKVLNYNVKKIECGLRINPEYSEISTDIYNPCFKNSRLGVTLQNLKEDDLEGISGLHFHTMCEQNSDTLYRTVKIVDEKFGHTIKKMKWINFGGGHHITKENYDIETLIKSIMYIKNKYDIDVYLEPGEAVALNAGFLYTKIMDIINNGMNIAILDTSAACHMPDVLEMPYRPNIIDSGKINQYTYNYRFGGPTCLAGDIIGDYSFKKPLAIGDILILSDMAIYSMVKNNTFNGINLPSIILKKSNGDYKLIKKFNFKDFKSRL
jgi:carboxynorspermidine decarboxylase